MVYNQPLNCGSRDVAASFFKLMVVWIDRSMLIQINVSYCLTVKMIGGLDPSQKCTTPAVCVRRAIECSPNITYQLFMEVLCVQIFGAFVVLHGYTSAELYALSFEFTSLSEGNVHWHFQFFRTFEPHSSPSIHVEILGHRCAKLWPCERSGLLIQILTVGRTSVPLQCIQKISDMNKVAQDDQKT